MRYSLCLIAFALHLHVSASVSAQALAPVQTEDREQSKQSLLFPAALFGPLEEARSKRAPGPKRTGPDWHGARAAVLATANDLLAVPTRSVMDKSRVAASGDKHDYLSFGPYWWPNPDSATGLPYVRRDGVRNPDLVDGNDSVAFRKLCSTVETLGLAFALTAEERYAVKAVEVLRVWFITPATRMNPNFQHAQAIPGVTDGRGIGIIEARVLIRLNEGLALLGTSRVLRPDDRAAMQEWMASFYSWLKTSAHGVDESNELNNHGTWYDAQLAHLALMLGRRNEASLILRDALQRRLAEQIEPDGSQPHELARTRSLSYSIFNLEAMIVAAQLGEHVGVDWWNFKTRDGRSLEKALEYIAPYADPLTRWPREEVVLTERHRIVVLLEKFLRFRENDKLRRLFMAFRDSAMPESYTLLFN